MKSGVVSAGETLSTLQLESKAVFYIYWSILTIQMYYREFCIDIPHESILWNTMIIDLTESCSE